MVLALKIILLILDFALGSAAVFVANEYKKFRKSAENDGASMMERFILGTIAFSTLTLIIGVMVFFAFVIASSLTVTLPF